MLNILVPALWILFDVLICLRTGYMMGPFSRLEWWAWLISGILLAVAAVLAGWWERRQTEKQSEQRHKEIQEGQEIIAGGTLKMLASATQTTGQPASTIVDAAVSRINQLESIIDRYSSIFWVPLSDVQQLMLTQHLIELGVHRVRISSSQTLDCIELARDIRHCFERAGWDVEKLDGSDRWGSAVANGLMFIRKDVESRKALNSGVLRALSTAISYEPILLYKHEGNDDEVDIAIIVGTKKVRDNA